MTDLAYTEYRLSVVLAMPDGDEKKTIVAAICARLHALKTYLELPKTPLQTA